MKDQEFHKWYKRLIENSQEVPPERVWDNIHLELDRDFYDWYRRQVENPTEEPPEAIWDNIENHLDEELYQWYRKGTEDAGPVPPVAAWDNIENQMDEGLYQWYKEGVEHPSYDPSEKVWNNIQDELDIDHTWHRIKRKLDRSGRKRTIYMARAAAAILLLLLALQLLMPPRVPAPYERAGIDQVAQKENRPIPADKDQPSSRKMDFVGEENLVTRGVPGSSALAAQTAGSTGSESLTQKTSQQPFIQREKAPDMARAVPVKMHISTGEQLASLQNPGTAISYSPDEKESEGEPVKYYAGFTGEIGNSWLLSNKTIYSIRKSPYSSASPELGKSYGMLAGASLTHRFDVQMEAFITNEAGQNYREYSGGELLSNQIHLNYASIKISGRYEIIRSSFNLPLSHHIVLGAYGSYLKDARQKTGGQAENIRNAYKNYNLGLVVGYEFDTHIAPNYSLSAGLRFNPGFINIYEGTSFMPARFNKTYSSSVNINVALKYNLSSR